MRDNEAILIIADSEKDSNMYYATGFLAPDPFVYIRKGDETFMVANDLELDRARLQSRVDRVLPLSKYERLLRKKRNKSPRLIEIVIAVLREIDVKGLLVPANFNVGYTDFLRKKGFKLKVKGEPFFNSREIKSELETEYIIKTLRKTESALGKAIDYIAKSNIKNGFLYTKGGRPITSESVR